MNFRNVRRKLTFLVASTIAAGTIAIPPMNVLGEDVESDLLSILTSDISTYQTTPQQLNVLNANDFEAGTNLATTTSGMFTFTDAKIQIKQSSDTKKMSADGKETFTQAIEFGGGASSSKQSVKFTVSRPAIVTFYATKSGSDTDDERQVVLKSAEDNTVVAKTTNLLNKQGNKEGNIEKMTFEIKEAGDYYLGSAKSGIYLYKLVVEEEPEKMILNANNLDLKTNDLKEDTVCGDFTIKATASKNVTIDTIAEEAAADGTKFSKAINLKGTGKEGERSIHFTTTEKAYVEVYSRSGGDVRTLKLNGPVTAEINAPAKDDMIAKSIIEITPGDYYLASAGSGINVYAVNVVMGELPEQEVRADWSTVTTPQMLSVDYKEGSNSTVEAHFSMLTGADGADTVTVEMKDANGDTQASKTVGRSSDLERSVEFTPTASGTYSFAAKAERIDESEVKLSDSIDFTYKLPLSAPNANAYNKGGGDVLVKWGAVKEADAYIVEYQASEGEYVKVATVNGLETVIKGLNIGETYNVRVTAVRGSGDNADIKTSQVATIEVKDQVEREWAFTYFGQSVSSSLNTIEVVDQEDLTLKLNSCSIKADGTIDKKGGKFTTFHDGVSYYYTEIDADKENFELTATFTVDYINPAADGQEGFGIIAMDSLGDHGVASVNHYTNSAGVIATKFEGYILDEDGNETGTKVTLKDGMGSRMVSGITPEVLAQGDTGIAATGKSIATAYELDANNLIKQGDTYTLTLKKTNTGYHMIYDGKEHIMYNPEKLLQLEQEKVYVGFAAARGCNVTVSDISMKITDPATDAPAVPEPVQTIKLKTKIDAPTTSGVSKYNFVFNANADGVITVKDSKGNVVIEQETVRADQDYSKVLNLVKGNNDFAVTFIPNEGYVNGEGLQLNSYNPVTINHSVSYKSFAGSTIYVTPNGKAAGEGTVKSPVDIYTAVKYVAPGQIICLANGTYNMTKSLVIPRGINGTSQARITLKSETGGRAILDFTNANGGMQLWSDYWHVYGIDVCHTPGNVKGLQIAGHSNIIESVDAYSNGDTGIQISGTGTEKFDKWPSHNLILNCTSYDNIDPGENNADGFAAKITCGEGNIFRGCIAYNNLDDGWDLYSKIESGPIGAVTLENCITYKNGTLTNGYGDGDGNGFKLGGDGIAVPHVLRNSISFGNNAVGITSNSDPAIILENNTSFGNAGGNISLYGKGGELSFIAKNNISMQGGTADNYSGMTSLVTEDNFFYDGTQSINSVGVVLSKDIFASTDINIVPTRNADGSINMNGLLELNEKAPAGIGARLEATKGEVQVPVEKPIQGGSSASNDSDDNNSSTPNNGPGSTVVDKTPEKTIEEALKADKTPEIKLDKNNTVTLPSAVLDSLIDSGKGLIVKVSDQIKVVVKSQTLKEQKGEAIQIKAAVPSVQIISKIENILKENDKMTAIGGKDMLMTLSVTAATEVKSFNEPIGAVLAVDAKLVKDTSKLTAVRYEEQKDGSIKMIKIGGAYNKETGEFNFLTDKAGTFGLVVDEDLRKVNLSTGTTQSLVNGQVVINDVAPMIVEDRTMLPVRFIAESLGGKVGYKNGQVTISVEDKTIAFKVGVNLENYDVKPFISQDRTFISARWVAEELGAHVLWVPSSGQVEIVK